jgi:hypothetical protein
MCNVNHPHDAEYERQSCRHQGVHAASQDADSGYLNQNTDGWQMH